MPDGRIPSSRHPREVHQAARQRCNQEREGPITRRLSALRHIIQTVRIAYLVLCEFDPKLLDQNPSSIFSLGLKSVEVFVILEVNRKPYEHSRARRNERHQWETRLVTSFLIHDAGAHTRSGLFVSGDPLDVIRNRDLLVEFEVEDILQ